MVIQWPPATVGCGGQRGAGGCGGDGVSARRRSQCWDDIGTNWTGGTRTHDRTTDTGNGALSLSLSLSLLSLSYTRTHNYTHNAYPLPPHSHSPTAHSHKKQLYSTFTPLPLNATRISTTDLAHFSRKERKARAARRPLVLVLVLVGEAAVGELGGRLPSESARRRSTGLHRVHSEACCHLGTHLCSTHAAQTSTLLVAATSMWERLGASRASRAEVQTLGIWAFDEISSKPFS